MEEKLRNLSNNIENNTGENAYKPKPADNDEPNEEKHEEEELRQDEELLNEPETDEAGPEEKPAPEAEPEETPEEIPEEPAEEEPEEEPAEEPEPEEEPVEEPAEEPEPSEAPKAAILTMNEDDEVASSEEEEPAETPEEATEPSEKPVEVQDEPEAPAEAEADTDSPKYSPEVEAALNRLDANDSEEVSYAEPLSTESKKKSHGGLIFLIVLAVLAVVAVALCILVEQGIIENPFPTIGKKDVPAPNIVEPEEEEGETPLTDSALITAIDLLFEKARMYDNYYIYKRTHEKDEGVEYINYYVAEPIEVVRTNQLDITSEDQDTVDSPANVVTPNETADNCEDAQNCTTTLEVEITADNYNFYPTAIYRFKKNRFDIYEFYVRDVIELETGEME